MKNIKKIAFLLLSSVTMTLPAFADAPYILGQIGARGENDWSNDSVTGRVAVGYQWDTLGKNISEQSYAPCYSTFNFGAELGYQFYEDETASYQSRDIYISHTANARLKRNTADLLAVIDIKPNAVFDIFAKVGPALVQQKLDFNYAASDYYMTYKANVKAKQNAIVPKLIVGAGVDVSKNVNLNISYAHEFETNKVDSASSVMAGVKINFC